MLALSNRFEVSLDFNWFFDRYAIAFFSYEIYLQILPEQPTFFCARPSSTSIESGVLRSSWVSICVDGSCGSAWEVDSSWEGVKSMKLRFPSRYRWSLLALRDFRLSPLLFPKPIFKSTNFCFRLKTKVTFAGAISHKIDASINNAILSFISNVLIFASMSFSFSTYTPR